MAVTIAVESPLQDDVRELIAALNAHLLEAHPTRRLAATSRSISMADANTTVWIARDEGAAVACGALRRHGNGIGEVKRMYTLPSHRGQHIGGDVLGSIEARAREEGLTQLVLETGHVHDAAWRVTSAAGSRGAGACSTIPLSNYSIFYEKAR